MLSVILALIAIIGGGALYPVSKQSPTAGLFIGGAALIFAILGIIASRRAALSGHDSTNKKEGLWLSVAGGLLTLVAGAIVLLVK